MTAQQPAGGKWVARALYGLMLLVLISVGWWAIGESTPEAPPPPPREVTTPPVPRRPPPPPERDDPPPLAVDVEPPSAPPTEPLTAPPPPVTPHSLIRPPKHPVDPEVLAREKVLLERARAEVTSDPETALKSLAEHKRLFPKGPLAQEAELVHVEALLRLGRRPEAEVLGRKLSARDEGVTRAVERLLRDVRSN